MAGLLVFLSIVLITIYFREPSNGGLHGVQSAGATVLRGAMGFGKSSRLHTSKILRLSMDLPIVIEIVDSEEKINAFLPALEGMMSGGMVTLERVQVIEYLHEEREE